MRVAFGLDLSGYSTGHSALARAESEDGRVVHVTLYRGHALGRKPKRTAAFEGLVSSERKVLASCCARAPLHADVPIDLQGLPCPPNPQFAWQLTLRPVDKAVGGLPPLPDRIGAPVARFQHLIAPLRAKAPDLLGGRLFETYPAASLKQLGISARGYKDQSTAFWTEEGRWRGSGLAELAGRLNFRAEDAVAITDHDLDAAICAIMGVVGEHHLAQGDELASLTRTRLGDSVPCAPPAGYVLLRSLPRDLEIHVQTRPKLPDDELLKEISR